MKRSAALLLAGAMTVFLSACGKEQGPTRPEVQKEPAAAMEAKDIKDIKSDDSKSGDAALGDRADGSMDKPVPMEPTPPAEGPTDTPTPAEGQQP
ncbi:MAG: hypothetical protein ACO1N3_03095 [Gammaproteobacteria bacterium]